MTDPAQARQQWLRLLAAGRRARRQRLQLLALATASALTLCLAGGSWVLTSYVSDSLGRVNAGTSGTPSSGPINILVAGIDTRGGLTKRQEIQLHVGDAISYNTDTLMLVHIPANHASAEVVSLPRDTWLSLPGHGMNKINAALAIGGPQLMVKTVEQATGLVINDYVEIDFLGFVKVIDALGGVNVCLPFAVNDPDSGLHMAAGRHHVDGVTALEFVRDRHSFALSDIARIGDQQQLLSSVFTEATSSGLLANPIRLQQFLSSFAAAVKVDNGFNLIELAQELRGLRSQDVTFTTVPLASLNYMTPTGQSAVLWNKAGAAALFRRLRDDTGLTAGQHRDRSPALARAKVSVDVYNGTMITGLSASTGRQLAALGFSLHRAGLNWSRHDIPRTVIEYPPRHEDAAALVHQVLPGAAIRAVPGLVRIRIVLGTAGYALSGAGPSASSNQPAVAAQAHTAAQDACR
jgi:LCP family protein required for cell wall assembly